MTMQKVLDRLEADLSPELKEVIIENFNKNYGTSITKINDDERIFSAIYAVLVNTLAHIDKELVDIANSEDDELDGIPKEEIASFKVSSGYASHILQTAMELAEVNKVIKSINSDD